jgi:acyl-coenzyme A thioesterase 13
MTIKRKKRGALGLENYRYPDLFGKWMGYRLRRADRKKLICEFGLKIGRQHLSPSGRVHGGAISGLFDIACGGAAFLTLEKHDFVSTVEIKVNYLRPLLFGDEVVARTSVVFRGKRLCVVQGFLYKKGERAPAAMATATLNVVSGSPGS